MTTKLISYLFLPLDIQCQQVNSPKKHANTSRDAKSNIKLSLILGNATPIGKTIRSDGKKVIGV